MLADLKRYHKEMRMLLDELDELAGEPVPSMERLPAVRLALTRASRGRTMLLEQLHATLIERATPAQRIALEAFKAEGKHNLTVSAQHIGSWTLREITSRWSDYCKASNRMRADMRQRIAREEALVYPLLAGEQAYLNRGATAPPSKTAF